jgi:hypothetical protein
MQAKLAQVRAEARAARKRVGARYEIYPPAAVAAELEKQWKKALAVLCHPDDRPLSSFFTGTAMAGELPYIYQAL